MGRAALQCGGAFVVRRQVGGGADPDAKPAVQPIRFVRKSGWGSDRLGHGARDSLFAFSPRRIMAVGPWIPA